MCFRLVFSDCFCAVCVSDYDVGFLTLISVVSGFSTLTVGTYREAASCAILQICPSDGSCLLLSSLSLECLEISDTVVLRFGVLWRLRGRTTGLVQKRCAMVLNFNKFQSMAPTSLGECFHIECGRGCL